MTRTPKAEVVKAIYSDLDFAIANLPDKAYDGHVVKVSALALKARVLLHNEQWAEAASCAKQVIENSNCGLSANYIDIWKADKQQNNPEILFSAQFLNPTNQQGFYGADIVYNWWLSTQPYHYIIDEYECLDGKSIKESPMFDEKHPYDNRDPRLRLCNYVEGDPWYYGKDIYGDGVKRWQPGLPTDGGRPATDFLLKKFESKDIYPISYANKTDWDAVLLRYAEVLLIYAEAQNESNGPDQSVYDAVNKVRQRVGMPPIPSGLSKEQLRDRIRHERRIELAYEGKRFLDLKRWKIAHIVIPQIVDPSGIQHVFTEKHYLLPIPQIEIDINPNLKQNPGY